MSIMTLTTLNLYSRVAGTGGVLLRAARLVDDVVSAFVRISHRLGFDGHCRCRLEREYCGEKVPFKRRK